MRCCPSSYGRPGCCRPMSVSRRNGPLAGGESL
jgi:hypothetical protein